MEDKIIEGRDKCKAIISDNWCGDYEATICIGSRRLYGCDFSTADDAEKWAQSHLDDHNIILQNESSLSYAGPVKYKL